MDLLWTGGWDSTFRLLDLLHRTSAAVRPWYVVDETRRSIGPEIHAMRRIREAVAGRDPARAARILPTRFAVREQIAPDPVITAFYQRLKRKVRVGMQYDYLARLAAQEGLDGLELSVHDRAHGLGAEIAAHAERVETPHGPTLRLAEDPADPDLELFRPFAFPLLGWSKHDMERSARAGGFADLLELTWFCHRPRGARPCGRCRPCQQVLQGGMGRRLPPWSRLLGRLRLWRRRAAGAFGAKE